MLIKNVETVELFAPLGEFKYPAGLVDVVGWGSILVKVYTDEEIIGLGEAGEWLYTQSKDGEEAYRRRITLVKRLIDKVFRPALVGENPLKIEKVWRKMYNLSSYPSRRSLGDALIEALSGVDIALWDIKGKAVGLPVCELLGGALTNRVKVYASAGLHREPERLAEEVKLLVKKGYRGYKMRVHGDFKLDVERVKTVRESLGENIDLMVDTGCALHSWGAEQTIRFAKEIEGSNIYWLEDPVPRFDIDGYRKVKREVNIPIAMGEQYYTREDFRDYLAEGLVDIVQPDAVRTGGITEARKISILADSWGVGLVPHSWESVVALAANLHVVASTPNGVMLEYTAIYNPLLTDLTKGKIEPKDGFIEVSGKPGLGIELEEEKVEEYSKEDQY